MVRQLTTGFETGEANEHDGAIYETFATVDSSYKRSGTYSWRMAGDGAPTTTPYFTENISGTVSELFLRYAYRYSPGEITGTTTPNYTWALFGSDGVCHIACGPDSITFSPVVSRGGAGRMGATGATPIATANYSLKADRWYVIEAQVKVDNSAGTVVVKVNNSTVLSYTGDTAAGATTAIAVVHFGCYNPAAGYGVDYAWLDDIAVNDTTGSYQTTWPGLGGVYLLRPDGDGATTTWDCSTGTVHYTLVDDVPANTTDWVQAVSSGEIDLYDLEAAPTYVNTINLVEVLYQAAVTESGYNTIMDVVRQGTVNYTDGTSTIVNLAADGYEMYKGTAYYVQPNGSGVWGTTEVNALQAGVEIP